MKKKQCRKTKRKVEKTYDLDNLMKNLSNYLVSDFRDILSDPTFCEEYAHKVSSGDIVAVRQYDWQLDYDMNDAFRFKAEVQIRDLFKRYRFSKDLYSENELRHLAITKYLSVQDRLAALKFNAFPAFVERVLNIAASYISKVLGVYDDEEHHRLCVHGKRATVGIPAREACEAARWNLPISGSLDQIHWFHSEMGGNWMVKDYITKQLKSSNTQIYQCVDELTLTLVPKTFKSLRIIMPNTTIGAYQSSGIGEMIRKRLKKIGYNISTLQEKHRKLARKASLTGKLVTADLSSASDSITDALVKRLLPSDWYSVLAENRVKNVKIDTHKTIETLSFCTMGIGYTFPLQTLIFLSLLKAIEKVYYKFRPNLISVYGDDMIYHKAIHDYVVIIFKWLGFEINKEKTFSQGHFRESCGGDFFRGVDVRPFQPRNDHNNVDRLTYESVLYKYINGLRRRWTEHEIPRTLEFLCHELSRVVDGIKVVPTDYPDDSGVCVVLADLPKFIQEVNYVSPKHIGHGIFRFIYLRYKSKLKEEERHEPYYWAKLRNVRTTDGYLSDWTNNQHQVVNKNSSSLSSAIDRITRVSDLSIPTLKRIRNKQITKSSAEEKDCCDTTYVAVSHSGRYKRQVGHSCFSD